MKESIVVVVETTVNLDLDKGFAVYNRRSRDVEHSCRTTCRSDTRTTVMEWYMVGGLSPAQGEVDKFQCCVMQSKGMEEYCDAATTLAWEESNPLFIGTHNSFQIFCR